MTSPTWSHSKCSHISGDLHKGQAYGITVVCIEHSCECECTFKKWSIIKCFKYVWNRTSLCREGTWNMRIDTIQNLCLKQDEQILLILKYIWGTTWSCRNYLNSILKKKKIMGDLPAILTVGTNRGEDLTISSHFFYFWKKNCLLSCSL